MPRPAGAPAEFDIQTTYLDFDEVQVGTSATRTVFVRNKGQTSTAVIGLTLDDASPFTVENDGCSGTSLASGASCSVMVRFSPTSFGRRFASLEFTGAPARRVSLVGVGWDNVVLEVVSVGSATGGIRVDFNTHSLPVSLTLRRALSAPMVRLIPLPDPNAEFTAWKSGPCSGAVECTVTLDKGSLALQARFTLRP